MQEITFQIDRCAETGGYVARWDDAPGTGGITTQGESLDELQTMIADAVDAYFDPARRPVQARLHFVADPILALAR
jgi:predicted RNase H-like HicB family nuclease